MPHFRFWNALILSLAAVCLADDYKWPNPRYDALEQLLYEGRRSDGSSLSSIVHPCRIRQDTGASIGAEWLRFAFHDMATHDASAGTGGVDGSLVYELDRPENFGDGFVATSSDFEAYPNKYVARADIIALGAIFGVSTCGGPTIPFKGGRADTWKAGITGTPQPDEPISTHLQMFSRAGYSQQEMIQMVACGHTLGGVRSTDFPQLVTPGPANSKPVITNFVDGTQFNNHVVTEYLDGSTHNPLVVGPNSTLTSDLRVFSSDQNSTMKSLADANTFTNTCVSILTRMLNTVPSDVQLTNEIQLLPQKVHDVQLTFEKNQLVFKASFRLLQASNSTFNRARVVQMQWCDKNGDQKGCAKGARTATPASNPVQESPELSPVTKNMGYYFVNYNFVVPIDSSASISKFWFTVDEKDGKGAKTYNNGGDGYPVEQDALLFVPTLSTWKIVQNTTATSTLTKRGGGDGIKGLTKEFTIVAAVRDGVNPSRVYMNAYDLAIQNFTAPFNQTVDLKLNSSIPATSGYSFYSANVVDNNLQLNLDIFGVGSDGTVYTEDFKPTTYLDNTPYVAPVNNVTVTSVSKDSGALSLGSSKVSIWMGVLVGAAFWTFL